jgi:hypothetical protein
VTILNKNCTLLLEIATPAFGGLAMTIKMKKVPGKFTRRLSF